MNNLSREELSRKNKVFKELSDLCDLMETVEDCKSSVDAMGHIKKYINSFPDNTGDELSREMDSAMQATLEQWSKRLYDLIKEKSQ